MSDTTETQRERRKAEVCRLYSGGMTLKGLAAIVPESHETVRSWLMEQGIPIRRRGVKPSDLKDAAIRLYQSGLTAQQVSERIGVSPSSVYLWCKQAGVELRSMGSRHYMDSIKVQAVEMYERGVSSNVIGGMLGVSASTVIRWCRGAGLDIRPMGKRKKPPNAMRNGQP